MRIQQLLPDPSVLCSLAPTQNVLEATRAMVAAKCGSVLVMDGDELRGIFTERDLMVRVVSRGKSPKNTLLGDVMTEELYTTAPDRFVQDVRREMRQKHIRHVPVLDGDRVLAVLSTRNLLRADFEKQRDDVQAMSDYIRGDL